MSDAFSLEGKTALVTGGSRGIGAAVATAFLDAGARVIICARKAEELQDAVAKLSEHGPIEGIVADLSDRDGVEALATAVGERATTQRLDVLVNNAGATWGAPVDDFPEAGWDKVMTLNVKSLHYLTSACLPLLRRARHRESRADHQHRLDRRNHHADHQELRLLGQQGRGAPADAPPGAAARAEHILVNAIAPGLFESRMSAFITENPELAEIAIATIPLKRIGRVVTIIRCLDRYNE